MKMPSEISNTLYRALLEMRSRPIHGDTEEAALIEDALEWLDAFNRLPFAPTMPEPDWSTAPEDAYLYAVDHTGDANWFETQPVCDDYWYADYNDWAERGGRSWRAGHVNLPIGVDWRMTLRKRPEIK